MKEFYKLEIYKNAELVHTQEGHFSIMYRLLFQWYYPNSPYTVKLKAITGKQIDVTQIPSLLEESIKL